MSSNDKNQLAYYIIAGLIRQCQKELSLNKKINITLNSSVRDVFAKAKENANVGSTLESFAALRPSSIEVIEGTGGQGIAGLARPYALAHRGFTSTEAKTTNVKKSIQFGLVPTKFIMTYWFASPSLEEFISFFSRWAFVREHKRLNFTLDWMKNPLAIEIGQGVSFSIPEREDRWESSDYSIYEGELEVFGYTSSDDRRDIASLPTILDIVTGLRDDDSVPPNYIPI